jgi:hypothetical protein
VQVFADRNYKPGEIMLFPMTAAVVFTPPDAARKRWEPLDSFLAVGTLQDGRTMYAVPPTVMPEKKSETDRTVPQKSAKKSVMEPYWCTFFRKQGRE